MQRGASTTSTPSTTGAASPLASIHAVGPWGSPAAAKGWRYLMALMRCGARFFQNSPVVIYRYSYLLSDQQRRARLAVEIPSLATALGHAIALLVDSAR